MKYRVSLIFFFALILCSVAQEKQITFKEYSYSELFEMIEAETDSVFEMKDAIIRFNKKTDSLFIVDYKDSAQNHQMTIDKELVFERIYFTNRNSEINLDHPNHAIARIQFLKRVTFNDCASNISFYKCEFKDDFELNITKETESLFEDLDSGAVFIEDCRFYGLVGINAYFYGGIEDWSWLRIEDNEFYLPKEPFEGWIPEASLLIFPTGFSQINFERNKVIGETGFFFGTSDSSTNVLLDNEISTILCAIAFNQVQSTVEFNNNSFSNESLSLSFTKLVTAGVFEMLNNQFDSNIEFKIDDFHPGYLVEWSQFKEKLALLPFVSIEENFDIDSYLDSTIYRNKLANHREIALRSQFYKHYREISEFEWANEVYVELKDLETGRLKVLNAANPSFDTFFTLKTNQFLRTFSDYGTRPAKAIIIALYVILAFALFYVLFPNTWDTHGRKRLIDRYTFFFKYLRKNAGIHEVYLENREANLEEFNSFKSLISESNEEVPRFFSKTALAIYKWGISGTILYARILSKFDIVKGKWQDLPKSKKILKTIILTGAFTIVIIYDLLIKVLNALMLSVNAFTTLGFGEIPIRGIPRYLAIIQGFIGWFMLTIFSVSLISQLLN